MEEELEAVSSSSALWSQMLEVQKDKKTTRRSTGCASKEFDAYKQICSTMKMEKSFNPLDFWRKNSEILPNLSKLARQYLCIPAGNVSSERLGSITGNTVSNRRTLLSSTRAKQLVIIKKNFHLFK